MAVVAILVGAGGGYFIGSSNERNLTTTSTFVTTSTLTDTETLFVSRTTQQTSTYASSTGHCQPSLAVSCPPFSAVLKIQGANTQIGSARGPLCQTTNFTAVCLVDFTSGESGKVNANITFQVSQPEAYLGGAYVAFLVYSSAPRYVNFTSIPSCAFTSGTSLAANGCNIPLNATVEFQFNFTVSPGYNLDGGVMDSVALYMWQTCCFP